MNSPYAYQDAHKEVSPHVDTPGLEVAPTPLPQPGPPPPQWDPYHHGQAGPATICGLRRSTFFLALALLMVIIAAAVGGGVGGSLAVQNAKQYVFVNNLASLQGPLFVANPLSLSNSCVPLGSQCAASAVTVTVAAAATASSSSSSSGTSPSGSGTSTSSSGLVVPTGVLALDCPGLNNQGQQIITIGSQSWRFTPRCSTDYQGNDIGGVIVYSFHDCLQACASHNQWVGRDECKAVRFNADMAAIIARFGGDCFLKNGTDTLLTASNMDVTAVLSSSSLGTG